MKRLIFLSLFSFHFLVFNQVEKDLYMGFTMEGGYTSLGWTTDIMYSISEGQNTYNIGVNLNYNRNYKSGVPIIGGNTSWILYFFKDRSKKLKPFFQLKYKFYVFKTSCTLPECSGKLSSLHELLGGFGLKFYASKGFFLISHIDTGILIDHKFNGIENNYESRVKLNPMVQIGLGYDF